MGRHLFESSTGLLSLQAGWSARSNQRFCRFAMMRSNERKGPVSSPFDARSLGARTYSRANPMRIRSSRTLVFSRDGDEVVAYNYLANSTFSCSPDLLAFLTRFDDWATPDEVAEFLPLMAADDIFETIDNLVQVNAITKEGSARAKAEEAFTEGWKWGVPAALFHFSLQDRTLMSLEQMEDLQRAKMEDGPQPTLYLEHDLSADNAINLPPGLERNDLLQLMAKRRTVRSAVQAPVSLEQLSDCLFAGLGITGQTTNCVGSLPLGMTPSGGARNPYEAYVYARSISGLEPGFYHYAAINHSLARLDTDHTPPPSELLGGQEWADEMPCVIILFAMFERTMWKYDDANAYRVVLIEAGHIGQNVMLAATRHGLCACPSAALNHQRINECLGVDECLTRSPIYALTLAQPGELTT